MRNALSLCLCMTVLLFMGCGSGRPRTVPVRGKISYLGKVVPNGTIMFMPTSGKEATGEIGPDGSFTLTTFEKDDGAIPGQYTVVIVARADMTNRLPEDRDPLPPPIVPMKYTSIATSPLRAEVKDEVNQIDFELNNEN